MQQFKVRAGYEGFSCFWTVFLLVRFWWFTVNRESGHTRDSIAHTYSWRVTGTSAMSRAGQGTTGARFGRAGGIISGAARARDARAELAPRGDLVLVRLGELVQVVQQRLALAGVRAVGEELLLDRAQGADCWHKVEPRADTLLIFRSDRILHKVSMVRRQRVSLSLSARRSEK